MPFLLLVLFLMSKDITGSIRNPDHLTEPTKTSPRRHSEKISSSEFFIQSKLAIRDESKKWLNREIPFVISNEFSNQTKALILRAINNYNKTCVKFVPKKENDRDYLMITPGSGCNSPVGRQRGSQNVTLGSGCLYFNTIVHELMHSIGFLHEHQRPDRDLFITIYRENIRRGMEYEFEKWSANSTTDMDFNYDYNSVMQYEETAFSRNGRPTMQSRQQGIKLGPINGLSDTDIKRVNQYYGCTENNDRVYTADNRFNCSDLKWKAFNITKIKNLFVFGGNDSFGNRFYVCRTSVNNTLIIGQMLEDLCYIRDRGRDEMVNQFDVLTHSGNRYKWQLLTSQRVSIPSNAVIAGNGDKSANVLIGRCLIKDLDYETQVIGTIEKTVLRVAFNGLTIACNQFQVLLCLK